MRALGQPARRSDGLRTGEESEQVPGRVGPRAGRRMVRGGSEKAEPTGIRTAEVSGKVLSLYSEHAASL